MHAPLEFEVARELMAVDFPPSQDELLETFAELPDWDERYDYLIDLGRELPAMDTGLCTGEAKVDGCLSSVWLVMPLNEGKIQLIADSDSLIVKGLIVLLMSLYHQRSPREAIDVDPQKFFAELGLEQHLSPGRRNGLYSMVERIRKLAVEAVAG